MKFRYVTELTIEWSTEEEEEEMVHGKQPDKKEM